MEELRIKATCLLRRAGLAGVPRNVIVAFGVLCVLLVVLALWRFWPSATASESFQLLAQPEQQASAVVQEGEGLQNASSGQEGAQGVGVVKVDVEGAVKKPGVYELAVNARVGDAVDAAGGLARKAARGSVNLAQKLEDGTQIYIPSKQDLAGTKADESNASATAEAEAQVSGTVGKVNINKASAEELQALPGVGPVLAQSIVDYRSKSGQFKDVEDLKNVSGIGDVRFERLKDAVCV